MNSVRCKHCYFVFSPCKIRLYVAAAVFEKPSGLVYAANYLEAVSSGITASVT
jgi:hypothetical protein